MYVKFLNNKSVSQVGFLTENDDQNEWLTCDDSLSGKRLILEEDTIRAMTDEEISDELAELAIPAAANRGRRKRDLLLLESDKLVLPDLWESYLQDKKTAVSEYRQALRDLPLQEGFPLEIVWPELSI